MLGRHGLANGSDHVAPIIAASPLHFGHDDQSLATGHFHGKRRDGLRLNPLARTLDGQLDVLRIAIDAADDDHVLDAAGDEQLAIDQKPQIAGAKKWSFAIIGKVRLKQLLG